MSAARRPPSGGGSGPGAGRGSGRRAGRQPDKAGKPAKSGKSGTQAGKRTDAAKPGRTASTAAGDAASTDTTAGRGAGRADAASAAPRTHLTSRAAILAIVVCAIALSLAYPIREYIAQRREIAQLREQQRIAQRRVEQLTQRKQRMGDESYIRREARRRLHFCDPGERCYVVLDGGGGDTGGAPAAATRTPRRPPPWYVGLWRSVEEADRGSTRPGPAAPSPAAPGVPTAPSGAGR